MKVQILVLLLACVAVLNAKPQPAESEPQSNDLAELMGTLQEDSQRDCLKGLAETLKASLETLKARTCVIENEVQALKERNEVQKVAFSASLLASGYGNIGPYKSFINLVYKYIITNVGNAYNPNTGFFTAPVRGVYQFNIFVHGLAGRGAGAALAKNGHRVVIAYVYMSHSETRASNGASLLLEAGDVVNVQLWENTWIFDNGNHHSTFSGHLLFTL